MKIACRSIVVIAWSLLSFLPALSQTASQAEFLSKLGAAATERTHHSVRYLSDYVHLAYPGGDVPQDTGVCTDEVIRSYRAVGIDLQKEVHEDMARDFAAYPHHRQQHPDSNIDHRRVPNLMVFFARHGVLLPITRNAHDYSAGDIVTWDLGGGVEDVLFDWKVIGHYRFYGSIHN